jgi:GT2 family glycosyltransferase
MTDETRRHSVAVAIVSYGTSALVLAALPDLMRELARCARAHVVVVDNASPDDDGARLKTGIEALALGPSVAFVQSAVNGGFAAGNNRAFAEIRTLDWRPDAVLLLNPDAALKPGALAELFRVLDATPRAGFVGPRLVNPDGSSWVAAFHFPSLMREVAQMLGILALQRRFPKLVPDADHPVRVDWVTGAATLIRWDTVEALGDMDDGYFLYFEEIDYMLQGRRLGWESWHAPAARVLHEAGAATGVEDSWSRQGRQPAYWFQSWARYYAKNHGAAYARITAALTLVAMAFGVLQRRLRGRPFGGSERLLQDFAVRIVLARLTPPPASDRAATPGGRSVVAQPAQGAAG